jgi:hypothetical protein
MEYLGSCNKGLDAVLTQELSYQKSGFKSYHTDVRFRGVSTGGADAGAVKTDDGIVPLSSVALPDIIAYDRQHFPAPRDAWIQRWLDGSIQGAALASVRADGSVAGVGVMRACANGFRVGPVFGDSAATANSLIQALQRQMSEGDIFYIDVPGINAAALTLAQSLGMERDSDCRRMYTGGDPEGVIWSEIYGLSSVELG